MVGDTHFLSPMWAIFSFPVAPFLALGTSAHMHESALSWRSPEYSPYATLSSLILSPTNSSCLSLPESQL